MPDSLISYFRLDKKEHARYIRKLSNILRGKGWVGLKDDSPLDGITICVQPPTPSDYDREWTDPRDDSLLDGIMICVQLPTPSDYDREVMIYGSW
ncbi:7398_t:CDS:2 [Acaulospora colombiana]|uniref:7398_t:CDS:1 n=1 Tax=Acaulospora colombiana TaxID=27376 RepID=A0ACA9LFA9_9GLOM|nr:7398_t:CDS:2 [Acaulospora colombiana]